MALTNAEKDDLRHSVKRLIALGYGEKYIVTELSRDGANFIRWGRYKPAAIKKYYRIFSEVE